MDNSFSYHDQVAQALAAPADHAAQLQAAYERGVAEASASIAGIQKELGELRAHFDRRRDADQRAIRRWRKAGLGRDLVAPDHADLVVWLLSKIEHGEARIKTEDSAASTFKDALIEALARAERAEAEVEHLREQLDGMQF